MTIVIMGYDFLHNGETVSVVSRHGKVKLPAHITPSIKPGELFATFHTPEAQVNLVTSPHRDHFVKACEYKVTAVRIEGVVRSLTDRSPV